MRSQQPVSIDPADTGTASDARDSTPTGSRPLLVDLDSLLPHGQFSLGGALAEVAARPSSLIGTVATLARGESALWGHIARSRHLDPQDPAGLVYDTNITAALLRALGEGRLVYLVSGSHDRLLLERVADHLGLLVGWSASDDPETIHNLQQSLQAQGFDYFEPPTISIQTSHEQPAVQADWRTWARLFRVHQYAKNALVFVPLLTAHQFALLPASRALVAAAAFSLAASGTYILNDLVDVTADRLHSSKRHRPLASGSIPPTDAVIAMVLLLALSIATAWWVSLGFLGVLLGYIAATTLYSLWLKRVMLADVVTLAALYTMRVIAGSIAINVVMSEWLLAFSLFIFMSLALVKRYVEMTAQPEEDSVLPNRGYLASDRSMVGTLAAASGFNTVVVFALYVSSDSVRTLYTHPQLLWIGCPILIYWIARIMMLAHRRMIDDDPVIFALKDKVSWLSMAAICAAILLAM